MENQYCFSAFKKNHISKIKIWRIELCAIRMDSGRNYTYTQKGRQDTIGICENYQGITLLNTPNLIVLFNVVMDL